MPGPWSAGRLLSGGVLVLLCAIAPEFLAGCAASSPRFNSDPASGERVEDENEMRFATRIREEEEREDDRKIDVDRVRKQLTSNTAPVTRYSNRTPAGLDRDRLLIELVSYLGAPYEYGGNARDGIDCSGLTMKVYESGAARRLPRSAREQFTVGSPVAKKDLEFGDLVFFNTTGRRPSHVGIYIEDDLFAHASVSKGVTLSSLESTYYRKRFIGARRVVQRPTASSPR